MKPFQNQFYIDNPDYIDPSRLKHDLSEATTTELQAIIFGWNPSRDLYQMWPLSDEIERINALHQAVLDAQAKGESGDFKF